MTLSQDHRDYLLSAAITPEVIEASGIYTRETEPTGIVFPWNDGTLDEPLPQLRPDVPKPDEKGRPVKYRFPKDSKMILNKLRDCGDGPALIVEGTKQQYTALSYAPAEYAVYGLSGCWNWTDADLSWVMGREVFILFDGDLATNKDVHQAATEFAEKLDLSGAAAVKYVRTTARGSDGLDDVLAKVPDDKRAQYLALWIDKALAKLPKAPAAKQSPFFDKGGLQVQKATVALLEGQPAALTAERKVALYLGGRYGIDGTAFLSAVSRQLGDQYRPSWRAAMEEVATGLLFETGKILPERSPFTKVNCTNGMLDLRTLELSDHSPDFMSTVQVGVEWNPTATAPTYEDWLASVCPLQMEDLEEVAGTMLDPAKTPHKAAFLFGPSRSGKSTFLRLLQAVAGVENRTAVTLHDLSRDRFAAANVYGKMLNSAADLSSEHVQDLSTFKMMTGEDPIHGNRKYGTQFTFTNQALFAFSANELPTISESSRAYAERIKPFEFPRTFAGREDPTLEPRMMLELPGIFVRWVHAYRRVLERGGYRKTDESVRREFETRSDRVAQWVADVCAIIDAKPGALLPENRSTGRRESAQAFNRWAERNGGSKMGERKIFDRLGQIQGVVEVRAGKNRARAFNIVIKDDPNSDLGFSPERGVERAEARAERAESKHPSHTTALSFQTTASSDDLGKEVEVHGKGVLKLPEVPAPVALPYPSDYYEERTGTTRPIALGFDLETAAAEELFTGGHEGPFVRLGGVTSDDLAMPPTIGPQADCVIPYLNAADTIYGHNILGFDLLALARHHGADYDALASKSIDTLVLARLIDPPLSKGMPNGYYGLDQVARRLGHEGKTDDLKGLAKRYGGYDKIPLDSREYQEYLRGDLAATKHVYESLVEVLPDIDPAQGLNDYARREMRVVALQNRMTLNGWLTDEGLLVQRVAEEDAKRAEAVRILHERYGVPLAAPDRFKLKRKAEWPEELAGMTVTGAREWLADNPQYAVAQGLAVRIPGTPHKSPWATAEGKAAIVKAFNDAGAEHVPVSAKTGDILTSSDAMGESEWWDKNRGRMVKGMLHPDCYGDNDAVRAICEVLALATGARAKYAETAKHVTAQGRVHGSIGAAQGSGRWAQSPFTTMGKRGVGAAERDVMVADEGEVLITCDLSQVDMRAVAALSQDREYMKLFEPGRDAHMEMAEVYFGERTPEARQKTKAINHKFNYGGGVSSTAAMNQIEESIVQRAYDARAAAYPRVMEWLKEVRERAASGELLDNGFGRPMRPDPERAHTQGPALMGQGAARDIMCESLLRLVDLADRSGRNVRPHLRGVVHDEVIVSVPEAEAEVWSQILAEAFTWEWRGVPILCEVSKPAHRWSECK